VVQLDGENHSSTRFLRCVKNRFGTTSEVGVFAMTDNGFKPFSNDLHAFLSPESTRHQSEGVSVTITMEGTRPIPVEIQTLSSAAYNAGEDKFSPRHRGHGVSYDKLQLIFAVLERRAKVSFRSKQVFVNIAEGYYLSEPAGVV